MRTRLLSSLAMAITFIAGGCSSDSERPPNSPLCPSADDLYGSPYVRCGAGAEVGLECRYQALGCGRGDRPDNVCHCGPANTIVCEGHLRSCLPLGDRWSTFNQGLRRTPRSRPSADCPAADNVTRNCAPEDRDYAPSCAVDSDCAADGICLRVHVFGSENACSCVDVGCTLDDDCGDGALCECGSIDASFACGGPYDGVNCGHRCTPAECRSDADCGAGGFCSPSPPECWGPATIWACHHPAADECLSDLECALSEDGPQCLYRDGAWRCGGVFCVE